MPQEFTVKCQRYRFLKLIPIYNAEQLSDEQNEGIQQCFRLTTPRLKRNQTTSSLKRGRIHARESLTSGHRGGKNLVLVYCTYHLLLYRFTFKLRWIATPNSNRLLSCVGVFPPSSNESCFPVSILFTFYSFLHSLPMSHLPSHPSALSLVCNLCSHCSHFYIEGRGSADCQWKQKKTNHSTRTGQRQSEPKIRSSNAFII